MTNKQQYHTYIKLYQQGGFDDENIESYYTFTSRKPIAGLP